MNHYHPHAVPRRWRRLAWASSALVVDVFAAADQHPWETLRQAAVLGQLPLATAVLGLLASIVYAKIREGMSLSVNLQFGGQLRRDEASHCDSGGRAGS
ncbi:hypothetical protein [Nocardia cyriacigeorgica]|uniref:hypothetical protein n=1 Tax=Nocardia cyriacigeorgica TaxID=135487 RepID=UPI002458A1E7|nr:hypothetical protein [Nocardia cyriacigeorgica]